MPKGGNRAMNDNDIIKALQCCISYVSGSCAECPYRKYSPQCIDKRNADIADIIKRQKAEIADLKAKKEICAEVIARQDNEIDKLSKVVDNYESCLKCVEVIKANAIKEFADRLKDAVDEPTKIDGEDIDFIIDIIDSIVKEMAEEDHEKD
jgi:hypothetical protein